MATPIRVVGDSPRADQDTLEDVAVVADHRRLADDGADGVVQHEPSADHRRRVDFDTGLHLCGLRDRARGTGTSLRAVVPLPARVERMRHPISQHRAEGGVGVPDVPP
jgi:hypothetical protein